MPPAVLLPVLDMVEVTMQQAGRNRTELTVSSDFTCPTNQLLFRDTQRHGQQHWHKGMCHSFTAHREGDVLIILGIAGIRTNNKHMQFLIKRQQKNVWELLFLIVPKQLLNYQPLLLCNSCKVCREEYSENNFWKCTVFYSVRIRQENTMFHYPFQLDAHHSHKNLCSSYPKTHRTLVAWYEGCCWYRGHEGFYISHPQRFKILIQTCIYTQDCHMQYLKFVSYRGKINVQQELPVYWST